MYLIKKSTRKEKKLMVILPSKKVIHFGNTGYSDYTIHKNDKRKYNYILRHKGRENYNNSGINTAGFWSYHILWNKKTIKQSAKYTADKFKIRIRILF